MLALPLVKMSRLVEDAAVGVLLDLHVEEVGHVSFIFGVPPFEEGVAELLRRWSRGRHGSE